LYALLGYIHNVIVDGDLDSSSNTTVAYKYASAWFFIHDPPPNFTVGLAGVIYKTANAAIFGINDQVAVR
jgi:hypothetical protein